MLDVMMYCLSHTLKFDVEQVARQDGAHRGLQWGNVPGVARKIDVDFPDSGETTAGYGDGSGKN